MPVQPESLKNLQPAKKGEVRNPNGRGKGIPNSSTRMRRLLELTQNLQNPVSGKVEGFSVIEQIDMKLIQKARSGDLKAIALLFDRLEGKPAQAVDITSAGEQLGAGKINPQLAEEYEKFLKENNAN